MNVVWREDVGRDKKEGACLGWFVCLRIDDMYECVSVRACCA